MGRLEGSGFPEVLPRLTCYSLGLGKTMLSFKQSNLFPGFPQACACAIPHPTSFLVFLLPVPFPYLIFYQDFPRLCPGHCMVTYFGYYCSCLTVLLRHLASAHALSKRCAPHTILTSTVHALSKKNFPWPFSPSHLYSCGACPQLRVAVGLSFMPSQLGRMFCAIWQNIAIYSPG